MKSAWIGFRYILFVAVMAMSFSAVASAQGTQVAKSPTAVKVERFLAESGFEFKAHGTDGWTIQASTGTVVIGAEGENVVVEMIIAPKGKFQVSAESMSDMLKLAHGLDFLKVGIDPEDNLFVRSEAKIGSVDGPEFNATLLRIVNGHAKATAKMAPYLVK